MDKHDRLACSKSCIRADLFSSLSGLFPKYTGVVHQSLEQNFQDIPEVYNIASECKAKESLLMSEHGRRAKTNLWAQEDFTRVRQQQQNAGVKARKLRDIYPKHCASFWRHGAEHQSTGNIVQDTKVRGRTEEQKDWTTSQENYQSGHKAQGNF